MKLTPSRRRIELGCVLRFLICHSPMLHIMVHYCTWMVSQYWTGRLNFTFVPWAIIRHNSNISKEGKIKKFCAINFSKSFWGLFSNNTFFFNDLRLKPIQLDLGTWRCWIDIPNRKKHHFIKVYVTFFHYIQVHVFLCIFLAEFWFYFTALRPLFCHLQPILLCTTAFFRKQN